MGPQGPPTRAAASAHGKARRAARGSLPWTTGTSLKHRVAHFYTAPWPLFAPPLTILEKLRRRSYLNCAYMGPIPRVAEETGVAGIRRKLDPTSIHVEDFFGPSDAHT